MMKRIMNRYSGTKKWSGLWCYLGVIIIFLFCSTLISCKQKSEKEVETVKVEEDITGEDSSTNHVTIDATENIAGEIVSNNGGTVLLTGTTTYFYAPNDNSENSEYQWAIYAMQEDGSNKRKLVEIHSRNKFYIVDSAIYVSDYNEEDYVILKISLDTGESELLCEGRLACINTQKKELYYTANNSHLNSHLSSRKRGNFKMNIESGDTIKLCSEEYSFIEEVNGLVYLQAPHADNSNDAVLASVNSDGTDLKTIATIPAIKLEGDATEYEYVCDFGLCEDWLILSVGSYQGSGGFFYGGLVRMNKDGQQLERFYESAVDSFEIIDGWIYFNDWNEISNGEGKEGCFRMRPDLSEKEFLGEEIQAMYTLTEEGSVFYRYDPINEPAECIINDLRQCTPDGQNIVTLFHGTTAPQYEDSTYTSYANIELAGEYVYFEVVVDGYDSTSDGWRGHTCYDAYYRVHKDGTGLELLYVDDSTKCPNTVEDISYTEYYNERFEFSIEYPNTFVTTMLPANGDGIILESSDGSAKLTVSGSNNVMDSTVESCFDDFMNDHEVIEFKEQKDNWFVASWIEGDKILYMKKVIGIGSINTFIFEYPIEEKEYYDQVVAKLLESFDTPGILEMHAMSLEEEIYDYEKVCDLFINRFLIASPDKDDICYALKSDPSDFAYKVFVDRFDEERGMYEIRLNRCSDTAQNYFFFDPVTEKFYEDGPEIDGITSDDSIFFWSPF